MSDPSMHRIAVFDINGTLYNKSSKEEFFKYICFKKGYKLLSIFHILIFKLIGKARLINQTEFKENFFNYLNHLPPQHVRKYADEYWSIEFPQHFNDQLLKRVEELRKEGVLIICSSGGLDVYMEPLFERFQVDESFCTRAKYKNNSYVIIGEACKGKEKIRRLDEFFHGRNYKIVEAYSDDPEDILDHAERAYLVKPDGSMEPYQPEGKNLTQA